MVKLMMRLHYVSQGNDQGEFGDGRVSMWALPYES